MFGTFGVLEAFIIAAAVSLDAFAASFSYGSRGIKIPGRSALILALISTVVIGAALAAGKAAAPVLPDGFISITAFILLFLIGIIKLSDSAAKSFIRKWNGQRKEIKLNVFDLKCILTLYADPEKADADDSMVLCAGEALFLGITLSLDGIAAGFGAAIAGANAVALVVFTFVTGLAAIIFGRRFGGKVAGKLPFNVSWLGGIIFIGLAFIKLL